MPYDDPDPTDPMTLHAIELETADDSADCEMAECFVEEYLRMGFSPQRVREVFRTKGFAGPHRAYCVLGEVTVWAIIDRVVQQRGGRRAVPDTVIGRQADGNIGLTVLD